MSGYLFVPGSPEQIAPAKIDPVKARRAYLSLGERVSYRRLEDLVGCKWSAAVLASIGRGVQRPGQLERFIPGISTKVLNERLRKLLGLPAHYPY